MDAAASSSPHHDFSSVSVSSTRRPTIPPKPKSSGSFKLLEHDPVDSKPGVSTSTVGTQVNLLLKRRTQESGRNDGVLKLDPDTKRSDTPKDCGEELKSPGLCANKPVIPPKPSPAKIASPRRRSSVQRSSLLIEENSESSVPSQSLAEVPVPNAPVGPSDKSIAYQTSSEKSATNQGQAFAVSKTNSLNRHSTLQQFPIQYSGIADPVQRLQAQRKSTSLGRRTIFSPFTNFTNSSSPSKLSGFSHLDLTTSSQLVSLLLSHDKLGLPIEKTAPPPPPRRRNSQKPHSVGTESSSLQRHQSAPVTPSICNSPPIYAVVDKEKKWEARRLKEENERLNNKLDLTETETQTEEHMASDISQSTPTPLPVEAGDKTSRDYRNCEPISTSPPAANSWLGKYISEDQSSLDLDLVEDVFNDPTEKVAPVENKSFLFTRTNTVTFSLPSSAAPDETESESETDENVADNCEDNQGMTIVQLVKDDPQTETDRKNEKVGTKICQDTSRNSSPGPELEKVAKKEMSPVVLLAGVTEPESASEEHKGTISSDADLIHEIIRSQEQFKPQSKKSEVVNSTAVADIKEKPSGILSKENWQPVLPPLISRGSFRRRSWTCSEHASSFTESSPTSSSSSSLRERTISISGSINSSVQWADEGELSTGALGDAENSDAYQGGSIEDCSPSSSIRTFSGTSTTSKSKRIVSSIFASFGKGGAQAGSYHARKLVGVRGGSSGHRRKEKAKTNFFFDAIQMPQNGKKSKSEVYLTRGKAIRLTGGKETFSKINPQGFASSQESTATSQSTGDFKRYSSGSGQIDATTEDRQSSTSLQVDFALDKDRTGNSLQSYDDILSGLTENKERQAFYVAREILTSERTFVDVLNLLTVEFPKFVRATEERLGHTIISKQSLDSILGGLPNLKLVNESLIHDLEKRIASWRTTPKVSDIIIKTGPFLKHYSTYIRDYQKLSATFEQLYEKNPHFSKAVLEFEKSESCRSLRLKHFMLKPVQRMPQYALLLGDYLKNLDPTNEDYEGTVEAIRIVKEVAQHGNEAIRIQMNAEKLIQLQKRLPQNVILKSDRQLICEGELRKVCRKELQPRYFALMSDCLLCMTYAGSPTGAGSKELKLRYELPLTGMRVAIAANEDYQNEFSVISVARSFNLVAKSSKERSEWLKSLNVAIKNNIKKRAGTYQEFDRELVTEIGKVAPVWIADGRVTMCQSCTAEFTMTFRRHHCRACGKVVCSHCSGNEAPLQYLNFEAARVCDECYTHLLEEFDLENRQNCQDTVEAIRNRFKKGTPSISKRGAKHKKSIPTRLEIHGNASGSAMSGYLIWREGKKAWKKNWFSLMDRVLYIYAASEDIAAIRGIPILGYQVELVTGGEDMEETEGGKSIFQLTHSGQDPYIFQADSSSSAKKWISAMKDATVMNCDEP